MVSTGILTSVLLALAVSAAPAPAVHKRGGPVTLPLKRTAVSERQGRKGGSAGVTTWGNDLRYTTTLSIGTPAQEVEVMIDTGSTTLWIADAADGHFDHAKSSTFKYTGEGGKQAFNITYLKGFANGFLAEDTVAIGPFAQPSQGFLAANEWSEGMLTANNSGLIGLGWPRSNDPEPYWHRIAQQWDDKRFAIYLDRVEGDGNVGPDVPAPGGLITLGGVDESLFTGDINYLPLLDSTPNFKTHWSVAADAINVNGKAIDLGSNIPTITDTGSTLIMARKADVARLFEQVAGAKVEPFQSLLTGFDFYIFPCDSKFELDFEFNGVKYPIKGEDLVLAKGQDGNCLAGIGGADIDFWLLGDVFLKNVYSVHRVDPPALGFAKLK